MNAKQAAAALMVAYNREFGGKTLGNYRITYESVSKLLDEPILTDSIKAQFSLACLRSGIVICDLGDKFVVLKLQKLNNLRTVPVKLVESLLDEEGMTLVASVIEDLDEE